MTKKRIAHRDDTGILLIASGYAMNTKPGPVKYYIVINICENHIRVIIFCMDMVYDVVWDCGFFYSVSTIKPHLNARICLVRGLNSLK